MAEDNRDVLMMIKKGAAIEAECMAIVDAKNDTLATGFVSGTSFNSYRGNYFLIDTFTFEVGLMADTEPNPQEAAKAADEKQTEMLKRMEELAKGGGGDGKLGLGMSKSSNQFSRFMSGGASAIRGRSYSANLEPVSVTKKMDISSVRLLKACLTSETLDSAVLIKRRAVGAKGLRTYLRIDFTDLLITDFNWDEDAVIKETFKFICRKAEVQYRIENDDSTLGVPLPVRTWSVLNQPASSSK